MDKITAVNRLALDLTRTIAECYPVSWYKESTNACIPRSLPYRKIHTKTNKWTIYARTKFLLLRHSIFQWRVEKKTQDRPQYFTTDSLATEIVILCFIWTKVCWLSDGRLQDGACALEANDLTKMSLFAFSLEFQLECSYFGRLRDITSIHQQYSSRTTENFHYKKSLLPSDKHKTIFPTRYVHQSNFACNVSYSFHLDDRRYSNYSRILVTANIP